MKTTKSQTNLDKARTFLEIRELIKTLKKEENELKEYFADLIQDDDNLLVGTCILISIEHRKRSGFSSPLLNTYFLKNDINADQFKQTTSFTSLKIKEVI